jgi:hypothetical protein
MYEAGSTNLNHFSIDFGDKLNENKMFEHEKTPEQFVGTLDGLVNGNRPTVHPSEYFMRELTNGSMTNQMAMDTFKTYFTTINELLTSTLS